MSTERARVTAALVAFTGLGCLSATVPAVNHVVTILAAVLVGSALVGVLVVLGLLVEMHWPARPIKTGAVPPQQAKAGQS